MRACYYCVNPLPYRRIHFSPFFNIVLGWGKENIVRGQSKLVSSSRYFGVADHRKAITKSEDVT